MAKSDVPTEPIPNEIGFKITKEQVDETFSIEEWYGNQTVEELYRKMLQFCVDENGQPVDEATARRFFKTKKRSEFIAYSRKFQEAVTDSFVNPTKGD